MAIVERTLADGTKKYQVRVKDREGNWLPSQFHMTKKEAELAEDSLKLDARKGKKAISKDAKTTTLLDYWEVWKIENRTHVSEGWKISQDQMFRDYVAPVIGNLTMIQIGAPEIGKVLNRAQSKGIGDQTRKHIYSLLRKMFSDAIEYYEMLVRSPVKPKFHRPKVAKRNRQFLHPDQAWRLLEESKHTYLGPPIWIQTLAGLRPGEVQSLRVKHLSFERSQILIISSFNNKTGKLQEHPKQEDWGVAPIVPELKAYLLEIIKGKGPEDYVSPGPKQEMLSYNTYIGALARLCEKLKLPKITPHELRHTCTELWIQAGASAEDIRRLLNHNSLTATQAYIHRTDDRLRWLAGKVSRPSLRLVEEPSESMGNEISFPYGKKEAY